MIVESYERLKGKHNINGTDVGYSEVKDKVLKITNPEKYISIAPFSNIASLVGYNKKLAKDKKLKIEIISEAESKQYLSAEGCFDKNHSAVNSKELDEKNARIAELEKQLAEKAEAELKAKAEAELKDSKSKK